MRLDLPSFGKKVLFEELDGDANLLSLVKYGKVHQSLGLFL